MTRPKGLSAGWADMSGEVRSYRDLIAWQKGMNLCKAVYAISALFRDREKFGLTAQVRRAAVSVPSNIAEGYGRRRTQDYVRYLDMALGSLCELETQLILAKELEFGDASQIESGLETAQETGRVLFALGESVRRK